MAAPNIVNVTSIIGRTNVLVVTTTATAIVSNAANSNTVLKVNALYVSNIDGTNNGEVTIDIFRSSVAYRVMNTVVVPADSTLDVLSKVLYLEEGDSLRLTANLNSRLEAVCSYEVIA